MSLKKQDTRFHKCMLPGEQEDTVALFIDTGLFVSWRRKLKRFTMVDVKHPYTRFYLKSVNMLKNEEKGHLLNHYHMIHPFSMATFCYGIWMMMVLFLDFWVAPFIVTIFHHTLIYKIFFICQFSHFILMLLSFFTGYYDDSKNVVVLKSYKVFVNYLKTYFILDLLCGLCFILRILIYSGITPRERNITRVLLKIFFLCKLGRYPYWFNMFKQVKLYTGMNHYLYQALKIFLHFQFFLLMTHFVLYSSLDEFKHGKMKSAFRMALTALEMVLMVDSGKIDGANIADRICPIVIMFLGFVVQIMLYTNFMQLWHKLYSAENKQASVYNAFSAYMRYKALPMEKRERIYLYLNFKYQRHFYKDSSIKKCISDRLRREIIINASKSSRQKVDLFNKLPANIMDKLMANLTSEIYLPGDVIIKAGSTGKNMFFILAGTVVITTPEGKEVCFLRDGNHFGEIALVVNIARVANAIAVSPCELLKLNQRQFMDTLVKFPEHINKIIEMTTSRIARTQSLNNLGMGTYQSIQKEVTFDAEFEIVGEDEADHDLVNERL